MASDLPLGFTSASKYETFKAFRSSEGLFELLVGLALQITGWGPAGSQSPGPISERTRVTLSSDISPAPGSTKTGLQEAVMLSVSMSMLFMAKLQVSGRKSIARVIFLPQRWPGLCWL